MSTTNLYYEKLVALGLSKPVAEAVMYATLVYMGGITRIKEEATHTADEQMESITRAHVKSLTGFAIGLNIPLDTMQRADEIAVEAVLVVGSIEGARANATTRDLLARLRQKP